MIRHNKRRTHFRIAMLLMMGWMLLFLRLSISGSEIYHSIPCETKRIALTFDDGPHPYQTQRILDILDAYQVKATFFMIGVTKAQ